MQKPLLKLLAVIAVVSGLASSTPPLGAQTPGCLDTSFKPGPGGVGPVYAALVQPDGKIVIAGYFASVQGAPRNGVARLNNDGSLDPTFNPGTGAAGGVECGALQPDGKVLIGGGFTAVNGVPRSRIARLNANGSVDAGFNPGTGANGGLLAMALQPDGKVIIGGGFSSVNGVPRALLARLNSDGSVDGGFNPSGIYVAHPWELVLQPDGKILVAGHFSARTANGGYNIARLHSNGSLDASFLAETELWTSVQAVALQPDGKILLGGYFTLLDNAPRSGLGRLNSDGSLDNSFVANLNFVSGNNAVYGMALQPDGKVVVGGSFQSINGVPRPNVARLNSNGSVDTSFDPGTGPDSWVWPVTLQPDGQVLIGGGFTAVSGVNRSHVARLNGDNQITPTCPVVLRGRVFADLNNNCAYDSLTEYLLANWLITLTPGVLTTLTDANGEYSFLVEPGAYTINQTPKAGWQQACSPATHTVTTGSAQTIANLNFMFLPPVTPVTEVTLSLDAVYPSPLTAPCCQQDMTYILRFENTGTTVLESVIGGAQIKVSLILPPEMVSTCNGLLPNPYVISIFAPGATVTPECPTLDPDVLTWCIDKLIPGQSGEIRVRRVLSCPAGQSPPFLVADAAAGFAGTPFATGAQLTLVPMCSFDPNDLTVTPRGCGFDGRVSAGSELTYRIRFHNLGNGRAHNVRVVDALPSELDPATVRMMPSSHPYLLTITGHVLEWRMDGIELPFDEEDSPGSQGFLEFKVRPLPGVIGSPVINQAEVYFDLNAPVVTPTARNTFVSEPLPVAAFTTSPNAVTVGQPVAFTYTGGTPGASFAWNFGPDATPSTSTEANPTVVFGRHGRKIVTLQASLGDCTTEPAVVAVTISPARLSATREGAPGGPITLRWLAPGWRLQGSPSPTGPAWTDIPGASPVNLLMDQPQRFFRLISP